VENPDTALGDPEHFDGGRRKSLQRVAILTLLAVAFVGGALFAYHQFFSASCYERLVAARDERERIEIVKSVDHGAGSHECLGGLAQYWRDYTQYVEDRATLSTLLSAAIHEGGYHSPEFQTWATKVHARSSRMEWRRHAWVFLSQTDWSIPEARLLEAVSLERDELNAGRYTDIEMIHHCIAKVGRRLYPDSTWWRPLIQSRYGR
jgi:hypothetical protein